MSPNRSAQLLDKFAGLVEKAYARRMEEFLKFMPGITYLQKMQLVRSATYVLETIKAVYTTWSKYSLLGSPEDGRFQAFDVLPETGEKFSTRDIANKFTEEITKLRPMGIGPDNEYGKQTTLNKFLELIAKDPQFKGHLDEYAEAQEKHGEYPTADHILEAQVATVNRRVQVTPLDIMKEQGLDITQLDKPYTGMTKAAWKRSKADRLKKVAAKRKSSTTETPKKKQKAAPPVEEETFIYFEISSDSEVVDSTEEV